MIRFAVALFFVLALASPAWSQGDTGFVKQGPFVGVSFTPNFTFKGDTFDGQSIYQEVNGNEIAILPHLDKQPMFRLLLGYRYRRASIEATYDRTHHNGTFLGATTTATFQSVNLNGRLFFLTSQRVQPHLMLGASLPFFRVKNGSALGDSVGDARFRGWGVNSEAGVTLYPHRQFGLSVGYSYRYLWFDTLAGVTNKTFDLRPRFHETSGAVVVMSHVIF